jgi:hypothetical protein
LSSSGLVELEHDDVNSTAAMRDSLMMNDFGMGFRLVEE